MIIFQNVFVLASDFRNIVEIYSVAILMSASESLVLNSICIISAVKMAFTFVCLYSTYLGVLSVEAYQFIVNFQSDSFDLFVLMCTSLGFVSFQEKSVY